MTFSGSARSMPNHALKTPSNESETMRCGERSGMKAQCDPTKLQSEMVHIFWPSVGERSLFVGRLAYLDCLLCQPEEELRGRRAPVEAEVES